MLTPGSTSVTSYTQWPLGELFRPGTLARREGGSARAEQKLREPHQVALDLDVALRQQPFGEVGFASPPKVEVDVLQKLGDIRLVIDEAQQALDDHLLQCGLKGIAVVQAQSPRRVKDHSLG